MNRDLPEVQAGLRKSRRIRGQIANICWIIEKAREFNQNIYFWFIDCAKPFVSVDHNKVWKILQKMRIPDHLTCFLKSLYADQEAAVRTRHGTMDWFQIWKREHQGCILSACLFNLDQRTPCEMLGWRKHKQKSRFSGEISITSDMQRTIPLCQREKSNWRTSWWKWKNRVKKWTCNSTLKKLRSWHLVPSLHGKQMGNNENSDRLYFLGFQINADGDCRHEIKMLASSKKTISY